LGRIPARLVTPPHTAINLKKCLLGAEDIDKNATTTLFLSASSQTPMEDSGHVLILAYPGPGCTLHKLMVLVAAFSSLSEAVAPQAHAIFLHEKAQNLWKFNTVRAMEFLQLLIAHCTDHLL
jgi:hypothetical protein